MTTKEKREYVEGILEEPHSLDPRTVEVLEDYMSLLSDTTAEAEPVRRGRWTKSEDDWNSLTTITCSEYHEEWCFETEEDVSLLNYRYCPNCGARND